MDLSKWPVSNVELAFPVGLPNDVAFVGLCDIPKDVPIANRYGSAGNKLPDPVGDLPVDGPIPDQGRGRRETGGGGWLALWANDGGTGDLWPDRPGKAAAAVSGRRNPCESG